MIDLSRQLGPTRADHRLTLTTALPVTIADVTGATSLYYTPAGGGNQIMLFTTAGISVNVVLIEQTLALGTLTSGKPYDVFVWWDGGFQKEYVVWTNDTTRATALALNGGVWVKSGTTYKRYVGSFYTTSTTATEDSAAKRFLWNTYNRVWREMKVVESTDSWTYETDTYRSANASTVNRLQFVLGISEDPVFAEVFGLVNRSIDGHATVGIGLDATNTNSAKVYGGYAKATHYVPCKAVYDKTIAAGLHFLQWLEKAEASGTVTWYGDAGAATTYQFGMFGRVKA